MPRPFRPPKPLTPRQQEAAIRKLNAEFGLDPYLGLKGLLLGVMLIAAAAAVVFVLKAPVEPSTAAWGRVENVRIVGDDEQGSHLVLRVETGGAYGSVQAPGSAVCREGDRIALTRHRRLFTVTYAMAGAGCEHVP